MSKPRCRLPFLPAFLAIVRLCFCSTAAFGWCSAITTPSLSCSTRLRPAPRGRLRLLPSFSFSFVVCMCYLLCRQCLQQHHTQDSPHGTIRGGEGVLASSDRMGGGQSPHIPGRRAQPLGEDGGKDRCWARSHACTYATLPLAVDCTLTVFTRQPPAPAHTAYRDLPDKTKGLSPEEPAEATRVSNHKPAGPGTSSALHRTL